MGKINFALIRSKNPDVANTESIEEIESLNLSNCEITAIENLELFHHIKELNLSNNRITKLEELTLMTNLQILDVSNNCIDSEGLKLSFGQIPKSLLSINLTGNPCVSHLDVLGELQDQFIDLVIAIEEEEEGEDENEQCHYDLEEGHLGGKDSEKSMDRGNILDDGPLNADDILKMIVDRKCQLQNLQPTFNLQNTIQLLNNEMDKAIETTNHRKIRLLDATSISQRDESTQKRIDELLDRNRDAGSSTYAAVLEKIKGSAFERLQEIHDKHVHDLGNGDQTKESKEST